MTPLCERQPCSRPAAHAGGPPALLSALRPQHTARRFPVRPVFSLDVGVVSSREAEVTPGAGCRCAVRRRESFQRDCVIRVKAIGNTGPFGGV